MDLKQIDEKLTEMRGIYSEKMKENDDITESFEIKDGTVIVDAERAEKFQTNVVALKELQGHIKTLQDQKTLAEWGAKPEGDAHAIAAAAAAVLAGGQLGQQQQRKTLGSRFVDSDEFKALNGGSAGYTMQKPFEVKGSDMGSLWIPASAYKDVYQALPTGTAPGVAFGPVQIDPMVDRARRRNRVRDLFPVQNTAASTIEYFRVTGYVGDANNASVVPERDGTTFAAKPKTELTFEEAISAVRTIAHYESASRTVLADVPQLRGIIDNELLYGLRLVEDDQILNGTGTGQDLLGILNTPGIQAYSWSEGSALPQPDNKADAVRRAATKAILAYYEPTGVVVHPNDWEDMELSKDANGQYLLAVQIALGAEQRIWRLPVVDTPAMDEGIALVGAFGLGAQLYDREEGNVRIAEQHADFFIRNAVVVLAEERLALAVKRPESFVKVTFDSEPA